MEQTATIFDTWFNNTTKLVNDWREMTDKLTSEQKNVWEEAGKMQQNWMNSFQQMMQNMQAPFLPGGNTFNPFNHSTTQDAFTNMLKSTDIYTRLFQLWQPVFNAMQNNSFNPQDFWKLIDQNSFKNFVDRLFGFDAASPMKNFMDQSTRIMNMWFNSSSDASKSFGQMFGNSMPFFNAMTQINPGTMTNWFMEMTRSAQSSFAPFMGSTSNGSGSSFSFQPMMDLMEKWGNYMTKVNQMQTMFYKTSVSAWEKVMQAMANRAQEGTAITDFNQFYNEWSAINEREFVILFNTDEYAALQGELLKLSADLSTTYEKQMEALLQPYPVVFRSQLDEVYKVNHELRGRINNLEKMIVDLQNTIKSNTSGEEVKANTPEEGKTAKKDK